MHSVLRYHVSVISAFKRLAYISCSTPVKSNFHAGCRASKLEIGTLPPRYLRRRSTQPKITLTHAFFRASHSTTISGFLVTRIVAKIGPPSLPAPGPQQTEIWRGQCIIVRPAVNAPVLLSFTYVVMDRTEAFKAVICNHKYAILELPILFEALVDRRPTHLGQPQCVTWETRPQTNGATGAYSKPTRPRFHTDTDTCFSEDLGVSVRADIVIFLDAHIFHLQILGRRLGHLARVSRQRRYLEWWTLTIPDLICAWLEQASFAAIARYLAQRFADLANSIFVYASSIPTALLYWMISSRHTKLHRRTASLN